jgi:hypothetical protein
MSRWTVTALTIPGREEYLRGLLQSVESAGVPARTKFQVIYNKPIRDDLAAVERKFRSWAPRLDIDVYFNNGDPTISGGRNYQLNLVKSPLVCFVDDDVTLEGPVFSVLEDTLKSKPVGMVGLRSYRTDTDELFKPRDTTPHIPDGAFRWSVVQGMLAAGYTNLFRDVGGFNPRRRFWGEWTEFNLRMWRSGFPTGYQMEGPFLRHWENAPESPTRNMDGRTLHVLWGIICTALEYDAVDINEATATFWQLVEDRYLAYSFGEDLSPKAVLQSTLSLVPELSAALADITAFRVQTQQHPFPFKPFHAFSRDDLNKVLPFARRRLPDYRRQIWPERDSMVGQLNRLARGMVGRVLKK